MTYDEYMRSEEWARKRAARLVIDGHRCRLCDEDGSRYALEIHHRPSSYARIPHESITDDLITVCSRCHWHITDSIRSDRLDVRPLPSIEVLTTTVTIRQEITHGLENHNLQVDRLRPGAVAQRPDCRSYEQVLESDQTDFLETRQDGR